MPTDLNSDSFTEFSFSYANMIALSSDKIVINLTSTYKISGKNRVYTYFASENLYRKNCNCLAYMLIIY